MPELGESVTEGTVTRWLKKVGDSVAVDDPLVEVSTDKVDTEIPSPVAGTCCRSPPRRTTPSPSAASWLRSATCRPLRPGPGPRPTPEPKPEPKPGTKARAGRRRTRTGAGAGCGPSASDTSPYLTPLVRKLASENGVDLGAIQGTGVGGRIRKQDVLAAESRRHRPRPLRRPPRRASSAACPPGHPSPLAHLRGTTQKANRIRQLTAKKTRESLQTTAQLTQTHEVDMTKIVALRARAKKSFAEKGGREPHLPAVHRARRHRRPQGASDINASYNEDTKEITYYDAEHLGFAVDTEQGLLCRCPQRRRPVLGGLARAINDIADARSGWPQARRTVRRHLHDHQHR
jgi:2-oxoglutarate dehydrogenase E2 component (dihydrolipoamide succinyltransferase)